MLSTLSKYVDKDCAEKNMQCSCQCDGGRYPVQYYPEVVNIGVDSRYLRDTAHDTAWVEVGLANLASALLLGVKRGVTTEQLLLDNANST